MNKLILVFAFVVLSAVPAQAKLLDTTRSLGPGHVSGAVGVDSDFSSGWLELHQRVGLVGGLDLYLEEFLPLWDANGALLGAGFKWSLLPRKKDRAGLALRAGASYQTASSTGGLSGALLADWGFGRTTPYVALKLDISRPANQTLTNVYGIAGARFGIVKHVGSFVEVALELTNNQPFTVAGGIRLDL